MPFLRRRNEGIDCAAGALSAPSLSTSAGVSAQVVASPLFPPDTLRECVVINAHDRDEAARALTGRILADGRSSRNARKFACGDPTLLRSDRINRPKL
jgi:hypothetical protein